MVSSLPFQFARDPNMKSLLMKKHNQSVCILLEKPLSIKNRVPKFFLRTKSWTKNIVRQDSRLNVTHSKTKFKFEKNNYKT